MALVRFTGGDLRPRCRRLSRQSCAHAQSGFVMNERSSPVSDGLKLRRNFAPQTPSARKRVLVGWHLQVSNWYACGRSLPMYCKRKEECLSPLSSLTRPRTSRSLSLEIDQIFTGRGCLSRASFFSNFCSVCRLIGARSCIAWFAAYRFKV